MAGEIAAFRSLRRVQWLSVGWLVAAAVGLVFLGRESGLLALTLGGLVSIVAFRSLVGVVRRLDVDSSGDLIEGGTVRFLVRWVGLSIAFAVALIFSSRDVSALIFGISVTPLALLTEAGVQMLEGIPEEDS